MILRQINDKFFYDGVEYVIGELIVGTEESEYEGLTGYIMEIRDGEDKETENVTPDIYCHFDSPVHPYDIKQLEEFFTSLYSEPKKLEDISLDEVIMAPSMIEPLRRIEEFQVKFPIYVLLEDWAMDCNSGRTAWQFTDYKDARRAFNKQLSKEMKFGCISNWSDKESFRTEYEQDCCDYWIDGEYAMNHYKLTICKDELIAAPNTIGDIGRMYNERCRYEDFISQAENWDELQGFSDEEYQMFISDSHIPDLIDKSLDRNDSYWESYWETVSEVTHNLLREHLVKHKKEGAGSNELSDMA